MPRHSDVPKRSLDRSMSIGVGLVLFDYVYIGP